MMSKRLPIAVTVLLLACSGTLAAAVVHVSGSGQSPDYATAVNDARADAVAKCIAQDGTPLDEVYTHVTRANEWLASVILRCEVP